MTTHCTQHTTHARAQESIRLGHTDLGDHYYARGDLSSAFKCYVRARDYCTAPAHVVAMCLSVVRVAAELGNFTHVANYAQKAEQTPDAAGAGAGGAAGGSGGAAAAAGPSDPLTVAKLKAASGLALLEQKKYKLCARRFTEVPPELGAEYSDVLSAQDVALYGGLTALASFDRAELKSRVVDNIGFRNYLELLPELRELIADFHASRYSTCLAALDRCGCDARWIAMRLRVSWRVSVHAAR
jgi:COP9 signalosome complex subunit 1